ncbi:MAG: EAL domain-containing protein, partial [Acidobacteria bacterium]|nr:EAL domain-containing protein [Acidobacteriota bacterium]
FGTGYSSLGYLGAFPVDCLKIDRSFISGGARRSGKPEIAKAIVSLAHSLGLEVVAEGIESPEQLSWVRSLGCEQGQGFYFSAPMTAREATELLLRQPCW